MITALSVARERELGTFDQTLGFSGDAGRDCARQAAAAAVGRERAGDVVPC